MTSIIRTLKLNQILVICLLAIGISSAKAELLTIKSLNQSLGLTHQTVKLPDATNGAPRTQSNGFIYKLSQQEQDGNDVIFQPYINTKVEVGYQNNATRYDSDRDNLNYLINIDISVPLKITELITISSKTGYEFAENGPEIQEFYIEYFTGILLSSRYKNIPGLILAGQIAVAKAEYEVDDEVGREFGNVGRDQLNQRGIGGKYQVNATYQFKNNRFYVELTHTKVHHDKWKDFSRNQLELSYYKQINDKVDCGINAIRTEKKYNNEILGFDDIIYEVKTTCNWSF